MLKLQKLQNKFQNIKPEITKENQLQNTPSSKAPEEKKKY